VVMIRINSLNLLGTTARAAFIIAFIAVILAGEAGNSDSRLA
jgi:hypothetical protein